MLVLSRKKNESIIIDDKITIVVIEVRGDKVRLGIEAPKEVPVHRGEIYQEIERQQKSRRENVTEDYTASQDGTPVEPAAKAEA